MSCNIFVRFFFPLVNKYKISSILQSVSSRFLEKWFFICETNQFVRSNKLLWSAEFFDSFPLKVEMITSFTISFMSIPAWCGNSYWIFLMWSEISCKRSLTRISYFFRFEVCREEKGLLKRTAGIRWIPCISISTENCRCCFVKCGVVRVRCWCSAIRLGNSSLLYNFIVSLYRSLSWRNWWMNLH